MLRRRVPLFAYNALRGAAGSTPPCLFLSFGGRGRGKSGGERSRDDERALGRGANGRLLRRSGAVGRCGNGVALIYRAGQLAESPGLTPKEKKKASVAKNGLEKVKCACKIGG